jgi:hypothetical protein
MQVIAAQLALPPERQYSHSSLTAAGGSAEILTISFFFF